MSADDEARWDARWRDGYGHRKPSESILELAEYLPSTGRALDVAGGSGRHAIWLAQRGLETTVADVSSVALAVASERACELGLTLHTLHVDMETDAIDGRWDVVLMHQYLQRDLIEKLGRQLTERGRLIMVHPTVTNLERHAKPSARFLLEPGELRSLAQAAGLSIQLWREAWTPTGRHEAQLVAGPPQAADLA